MESLEKHVVVEGVVKFEDGSSWIWDFDSISKKLKNGCLPVSKEGGLICCGEKMEDYKKVTSIEPKFSMLKEIWIDTIIGQAHTVEFDNFDPEKEQVLSNCYIYKYKDIYYVVADNEYFSKRCPSRPKVIYKSRKKLKMKITSSGDVSSYTYGYLEYA